MKKIPSVVLDVGVPPKLELRIDLRPAEMFSNKVKECTASD